jgi:hypothetical protein
MRLALPLHTRIKVLFEVLYMSGMRIHQSLRSAAGVIAAVLFTASIGAPTRLHAQLVPPAPAVASVHITEGPAIELMQGSLAIIRWTSNNPGGSDVHLGVVHYGTDPAHLDQTAKNPIRLNHYHPTTVFRVRVGELQPKTTYYYTVASAWATGRMDPMTKNSVYKFTTP